MINCLSAYSFLSLTHQRTIKRWHRSSAGDFFDELDDPKVGAQDDASADDENALTDEELAASAGEWDDRIAQFNRVTMVGRVGNDPDPRYFDDGKVVVNLSLAVRRKYHPLERKAYGIKSGEDETDWYGLEIWGRDAEYVGKYVSKGMRIGIVGSLALDQWSDRETGEPRNAAKIIVKDVDILETRAESELRQSNRRGPSFYTSDDDDDDDTPFAAGSGGFFD